MMYDDWVEEREKEYNISILCKECYKEGRVTQIKVAERHKLGEDIYVICPACETPLHSTVTQSK